MRALQQRGSLFWKYLIVFLLLVGGVLTASSLVEILFSYGESKREIVALEREKATAAANRIEQIILSIEHQVRGTLTPHAGESVRVSSMQDGESSGQSLASTIAEQRVIQFARLLRNVPAIAEIQNLDSSGKERLRSSRVALDRTDSGEDYSSTPAFQTAREGRTYYGPVFFRNSSEPRMKLAVALAEQRPEVTVVEINLTAIWDVVSRIRVGRAGYAYVVDSQGYLIAHPDISMILQKRNLSESLQVKNARSRPENGAGAEAAAVITTGLRGDKVLVVHADLTSLGWLVFIERPLEETFAPLRATIVRSIVVLLVGLALSVLASIVLARRMVAPIRRLQEGAARVGKGELDHRIDVHTGDELEALADEFNSTAARLQDSVQNLERKVEERTVDLTRSVEQLTALGEVGQAISSTLDLETVLKMIVHRAVQISGLDGGAIYEYDDEAELFRLRAAENLPEDMLKVLRDTPIRKGDGPVGNTLITREPFQIPEMRDESYQTARREFLLRAGYRALLVVPMLREDHVIGVLSVSRKAPGPFAPEVVNLLKNFATQSAVAIQNARLFREIEEKGRQLEEASQHKSQFLASMSHELRTPLNAILGFNEMMLDGLCGEVPEGFSDPLQEMQTSGKHLLRLINNVLDLAKIEAGRMELALADYSVPDMVESVRSTLRSLAEAKGLEFRVNVSTDLPLAHGDAGRLTQCLLNLAGNSLKFTKEGHVAISVESKSENLIFRVTDSGIGIAPEKIDGLFTEFKQTDATVASEYGGTGLGLAITRQFIEMHGGRIWVESQLGTGSTFIFEVPLQAKMT
jgi:signal transduction histidine kinase